MNTRNRVLIFASMLGITLLVFSAYWKVRKPDQSPHSSAQYAKTPGVSPDVAHYEWLEEHGTPMDLCVQSGLMKIRFTAEEEATLAEYYRDFEKADCYFAEHDDDYGWQKYTRPEVCKWDYYKDRGYCKQ